MSDNFEKHLKRHYNDQSLSPEVMQRLLQIQSIQVNVESSRFNSIWSSIKELLAGPERIAVIALFLVLLSTPFMVLKSDRGSAQELLRNVAAEVALNHNKRLPSDFVTESYAELTAVMDKLDFSISKPEHKKLMGYQLTGARYCSLQGQIAGQLKLRNDSGEQHTLYVTRLSEKFAGLSDSEQEIDGLRVSSWQSEGLFFSLAR